jgi:outer membrane translocation and assembly module TamA
MFSPSYPLLQSNDVQATASTIVEDEDARLRKSQTVLDEAERELEALVASNQSGAAHDGDIKRARRHVVTAKAI